MTITEQPIQVDDIPAHRPRRMPPRTMRAIGATTLIVAILAAVLVVRSSVGTSTHRPPVSAPRSMDAVVRDLVARGVVPAATLDDGSQVTGSRLASGPRSMDAVVRDQVARGLVPAASLDDGSQVTG